MTLDLPKEVPANFREVSVRVDRREVSLSQARPCRVFDRPVSFFVKVNGVCREATPDWKRAVAAFREQLGRRPFSFSTTQLAGSVATTRG